MDKEAKELGLLKEDFEVSEFDVADYLKTDEDIRGFLKAAIEDGTEEDFLHALKTAARAKGVAYISKETGLTRTSLYKTLRPESTPRFDTVVKITNALGFKLMPELEEKIMDLEINPFDAAKYLETDEDIRLFLADAASAGPKELAHAMQTAARAKGMIQIAKEAGISREKLFNPEKFSTEIIASLGLSKEAVPQLG